MKKSKQKGKKRLKELDYIISRTKVGFKNLPIVLLITPWFLNQLEDSKSCNSIIILFYLKPAFWLALIDVSHCLPF
jgi:hypothetical protein